MKFAEKRSRKLSRPSGSAVSVAWVRWITKHMVSIALPTSIDSI